MYSKHMQTSLSRKETLKHRVYSLTADPVLVIHIKSSDGLSAA